MAAGELPAATPATTTHHDATAAGGHAAPNQNSNVAGHGTGRRRAGHLHEPCRIARKPNRA
eukprot:15130989-Alexandrium_andersonii.AAC.1